MSRTLNLVYAYRDTTFNIQIMYNTFIKFTVPSRYIASTWQTKGKKQESF